MFQREYVIQFSTVFVVFLLWFLSSFALRFFQYSASKPADPGSSAEAEANQASHLATQVRRCRAGLIFSMPASDRRSRPSARCWTASCSWRWGWR